MAALTIEHNAAEGTTLAGSVRGDGVWDIVRKLGWSYSRHVGIYIRGSRDRRPNLAKIEGTAAALREAGHDVELAVEDALRPIAVVEAERRSRTEDRSARLRQLAQTASARSDALYESAKERADQIPLGQPILVDHYSAGRDRRYRERISQTFRRSLDEHSKAGDLAARAQAAEANQRHREDPGTTTRRIERLEAELRRITRSLESVRDGGDFGEYAPGGRYAAEMDTYLARCEARRAELEEEIGYWKEQLAAAIADDRYRPWSREHFVKGDKVRVDGDWFPVLRVNAKTLSIPPRIGMGSLICPNTGEPWSWNDTVPYARVSGRWRAGETLSAPSASE